MFFSVTPSCNTDRRRRHHAPRRAAAPTTMIASRRSNNRLPPTHKGTGRVYMIKCIDHGRREGEGHRYTSRAAAATTREAEYRRPSTPAVENGHATAQQHNRIIRLPTSPPPTHLTSAFFPPHFAGNVCHETVNARPAGARHAGTTSAHRESTTTAPAHQPGSRWLQHGEEGGPPIPAVSSCTAAVPRPPQPSTPQSNKPTDPLALRRQ